MGERTCGQGLCDAQQAGAGQRVSARSGTTANSGVCDEAHHPKAVRRFNRNAAGAIG